MLNKKMFFKESRDMYLRFVWVFRNDSTELSWKLLRHLTGAWKIFFNAIKKKVLRLIKFSDLVYEAKRQSTLHNKCLQLKMIAFETVWSETTFYKKLLHCDKCHVEKPEYFFRNIMFSSISIWESVRWFCHML